MPRVTQVPSKYSVCRFLVAGRRDTEGREERQCGSGRGQQSRQQGPFGVFPAAMGCLSQLLTRGTIAFSGISKTGCYAYVGKK